MGYRFTLFVNVIDLYLDNCMDFNFSLVIGNKSLFRSVKDKAFALSAFTQLGNVIETKDHIL
ncbi:MAG: hypothetical protein BWY95_01839 [Bacteroidetes bacterium ADurb.BinA104]|nr:MAG: hypothetical protein BWY95_01839 [Bacteroidetes bacterium ADurb.BinA104]